MLVLYSSTRERLLRELRAGIRKNAYGESIPSRSVRVPMEVAVQVRNLAEELSCEESQVLRVAVGYGVGMIRAMLDEDRASRARKDA